MGKESTRQYRRLGRCRFDPWVVKIPWRRKWQPTPVLLPGESHGQRSLAGYSPWGSQESDMTERLSTCSTVAYSLCKPEEYFTSSYFGFYKESACNTGDPSLIPGWGRSPGEGHDNYSCILACKIPWTEEPGRVQLMGLQRVRHD